jgi:hypothetical protein
VSPSIPANSWTDLIAPVSFSIPFGGAHCIISVGSGSNTASAPGAFGTRAVIDAAGDPIYCPLGGGYAPSDSWVNLFDGVNMGDLGTIPEGDHTISIQANCTSETGFNCSASSEPTHRFLYINIFGIQGGTLAGAVGPAGPIGATGATGATGASGPNPIDILGISNTPPNPDANSTDQQACNIATFLADTMGKDSLQSVVSSINDGQNHLDAATAVMALIPIEDVFAATTLGAAAILYHVLSSGRLSDYSDALANEGLWSDVQCAIYKAIRTDGQVTAANYGGVLTNLAAITSAPSGVVGTIHDYFANVGANGAMQAQQVGSLYAGDCSSCSDWCDDWNFTTDDEGGWNPLDNHGTFGNPSGWTSSSGNLDILLTFAATYVTNVQIIGATVAACTPTLNGIALPEANGAFNSLIAINDTITSLEFNLQGAGNVTHIVVCGNGTNVFGAGPY